MSKREKVEVSTDIILQNQIIINEINKQSQEFFEEHGRKRTVFIVTYGCQMN
jgi:hypothetical protein